MAIKAIFANGATATTVKNLYQWDYGQQLEIEAVDLPALIEVHFACRDMSEAVVVPCTVQKGVGLVTIPNQCLEQSSPITAWVYEYESVTDATGKTIKTAGATTKTITIPVTARARPNRTEEIPQTILDKYAELLIEVNEAVGQLKKGDVVAAKAAYADNAAYATSAGNANYASSAGSAESAVSASRANILKRSPGYSNIYVRGSNQVGSFAGGIIVFEVKTFDMDFNTVGISNFLVNVQGECYSPLLCQPMETQRGLCETRYRLHFIDARDASGSLVGGKYHIDLEVLVDGSDISFTTEGDEIHSAYRTISYSYLSTEYPVG